MYGLPDALPVQNNLQNNSNFGVISFENRFDKGENITNNSPIYCAPGVQEDNQSMFVKNFLKISILSYMEDNSVRFLPEY